MITNCFLVLWLFGSSSSINISGHYRAFIFQPLYIWTIKQCLENTSIPPSLKNKSYLKNEKLLVGIIMPWSHLHVKPCCKAMLDDICEMEWDVAICLSYRSTYVALTESLIKSFKQKNSSHRPLNCHVHPVIATYTP